MKISKKYRSTNNYRLSIVANIDGISRTINFGGADVYLRVMGSFTTSDPKIQAFLESYSLFNKEYVLEKTETIVEQEDIDREREELSQLKEEFFYSVRDAQEFITKKLKKKGYLYSSQAKCIACLREAGIKATFKNPI